MSETNYKEEYEQLLKLHKHCCEIYIKQMNEKKQLMDFVSRIRGDLPYQNEPICLDDEQIREIYSNIYREAHKLYHTIIKRIPEESYEEMFDLEE